MRLISCLALMVGLLFVGNASAQYCHANVVAAPLVYAAPLVQYVAPVVQLQQVVAPAPIIQQQVQQVVQPQQVVTAPAVPVLQYLVQPLVQQVYAQQVVQGYHRSAAIVVHPQRIVQQQRFIVGNRAQRIAVVQQVRRPSFQLNIGGRRR